MLVRNHQIRSVEQLVSVGTYFGASNYVFRSQEWCFSQAEFTYLLISRIFKYCLTDNSSVNYEFVSKAGEFGLSPVPGIATSNAPKNIFVTE